MRPLPVGTISSDDSLTEALRRARALGRGSLVVSVNGQQPKLGASRSGLASAAALSASAATAVTGSESALGNGAAAFLGGLIATSWVAAGVGLLAVKAAAGR